MADRGRKARPISSRLCDERCQEYCQRKHKERLKSIKSRTDTSAPKCMNMPHMMSGNNHKKNYYDGVRAQQILKDNALLLEKMSSITSQMRVLKPWRARSSLNFKPGYYYDSNSSSTFVDNRLSLPVGAVACGGKSEFSKLEAAKQLLKENQKILSAIQSRKPSISYLEHARHDSLNTSRVRMISSYRGPESARYTPERRRYSNSLSDGGSFGGLHATQSLGSIGLYGERSSMSMRTSPRGQPYGRGLRSAGSARTLHTSFAHGTRPSTAPNKARASSRYAATQSLSAQLVNALGSALPPTSTDWAPSRTNSINGRQGPLESEPSLVAEASAPA